MPFLNQSERDALTQELKKMPFGPAKRKLRGMDPKGRLVFYRNNQRIGQWLTRFELPSFGIRATLVEAFGMQAKKNGDINSQYELVDVVVEPTADNRT
jgi:hypothetical protein